MRFVFLGAANPETARMIRAVERVDPEFKPYGFLDNDPRKQGTTFVGLPVFGGYECVPDLLEPDVRFVNLITGSTVTRFETSRELVRLGCRFGNFIHPSVDLTMTSLGVGNYIQENAVIQAEARIGDNSSIHTAAIVAHESSIGNSVFVAHAVSISGSVSVGDGALIGTNATLLHPLTIGRWAIVGAGALVTKDVPDYATVVGNPARVIRFSEPVYEHGRILQGEDG